VKAAFNTQLTQKTLTFLTRMAITSGN